ncbi:MAG TPA: L-seryl-tRNA(Sec) selenium transferase [Polyangia bacterium]
MSAADSRLLRRLPSVDAVLRTETGRSLLAQYPRWAVVRAARDEIEARRHDLGALPDGAAPEMADQNAAAITQGLGSRVADLLRPSLRPVLNATGVVLHTNLGRAPLSDRAVARIEEIARGYCTVEYDPARRERGSRHDHLRAHLRALTGAASAVVVNNNAAAVLLALSALASGREVIVSRGELVEIGGGFRIPDVMRASGARLVEVGTTNRTRLDDYLQSVSPETALLLKVHRSNFAQLGFTEDTSVAALASAGRARDLPVMVDLGSGAFFDLTPYGLPAEPTVAAVLDAGADVVTISGDKLLGGPQAGIIVGRDDLITRIARHPLMRAVRPDKLTLAALEATLESYRAGSCRDELPVLAMLTASVATLAVRAERLLAALRPLAPTWTIDVTAVRSAVGGGALPLAELETRALAIRHPSLSAEALARGLADGDPPVIARIHDDTVLLDLRTLDDRDLPTVATAVAAAARR